MGTYVNLTEVIIAIVLIIVILLQVRGQGAGLFGSAQASFRTRRGVELTLFRFTIFLATTFVLLAILSFWDPGGVFS